MSNADNELFGIIYAVTDDPDWAVSEVHDAVLAAGYRKPRTITTAEAANDLPDRSIILTPGKIAFQKWEDYYGAGKDAWERELGQFVPAELLSDSDHFPAIVLYEPQP